METTKKQFDFSVLKAEETGSNISSKKVIQNEKTIYSLEFQENKQRKLIYYLTKNNEQKFLKFDFKIKNNISENKDLISKLINRVQI